MKAGMNTQELKRGLLLLSGGFDSGIAGKMMLDQGLEIGAVHFSQEPFTDSSPEDKSREVAKKLGFSPVYTVNLGQQFSALADQCTHRFFFVLTKRLMLRVAAEIAKQKRYDCLITGENLGQVSSQTLDNLAVIDAATTMPVLRPLLGLDKNDIIAKCEEWGTFEISKGPELCGVLGPKRPATRSNKEQISAEEAKVDIKKMVESALTAAGL